MRYVSVRRNTLILSLPNTDFRKISPRLGTNWKKGIPLEVLPIAADLVIQELKRLGCKEPHVRTGLPSKAGSALTDNGNYIIDAPFSPLLLPKDHESGVKGGDGEDGIWTVNALAERLIGVPGIIEIGLFQGKNGHEVADGAQKPVAAYFGMADGSVEVRRAT
jgi:ribose 5-phosphate isomerase A